MPPAHASEFREARSARTRAPRIHPLRPPSRTPRARRGRAVLALAPLLVLGLPGTAHAGIGMPGGCLGVIERGVDVSQTDGVRYIRVSHGLAQGFLAPDTLVQSVTVWLPETRSQLTIPLHLSLVRAEDDGRPIPDAVIADGGSLDQGDPDDATASARYTYVFDPPAMLPAAGRYALVLVPDRCNAIPVLTDEEDGYADGELWELAQRQCGGRDTWVSGRMSSTDLGFRIDFCDGGTATTGRTWGELKTLYR